MNTKRIFLSSVVALGALMGFAQAQEVTEYEFLPHFYLQGQLGAQETLGEGSFGDTFSVPTIQLGGGYQFNPLFGARLSVNFLGKGKGVLETNNQTYKWGFNHLSAMLDGTFNLTNAFGGYNPERKWDLNLIAGFGLNFASGNDEANNVNNALPFADGSKGWLANVWDGSHTWMTGRIGVGADYKIDEAWSVGIELQANCLTDKFNSKKSSNMDWYFNGLVGVKYAFGPTYNKKTIVVPDVTVPEVIRVVDTLYISQPVVPAVVEKTLVEEVVEAEPIESLTRNVFYKINSAKINSQEMAKVAEVAEYMKSHPNSTVHVTGYADKGTGTLAINLRLARERAAAVVRALTKTYGIKASRITSSSMTDHEFQPFEDPVLNRVAICVVE